MPASPGCSSRGTRAAAAARRRLLDDRVADVGPVEARDELARVLQRQPRRRSPARVGGSAVAVSAMRGTPGKRSASTDSRRYSGRKSCPHCDTQCASSMAKSASRCVAKLVRSVEEARRRAAARARRRGGRARRRGASRSTRARSRASCVELRNAARHASSRQRRRPGPASARSAARRRRRRRRGRSAGNLVAERLAAAGRHQHERVAAARRRARRSPACSPRKAGWPKTRRRISTGSGIAPAAVAAAYPSGGWPRPPGTVPSRSRRARARGSPPCARRSCSLSRPNRPMRNVRKSAGSSHCSGTPAAVCRPWAANLRAVVDVRVVGVAHDHAGRLEARRGDARESACARAARARGRPSSCCSARARSKP